MSTKIEKKKIRASPVTQIDHTQDLFRALVQDPTGNLLNHLLASFDPQSRRILDAIARALINNTMRNGKHLAMKSGQPWFEFSFVNPDGESFALPRLHNLPASGIPKNADVVKCRKCGHPTFYLMIIIKHPARIDGETPRPKIGYLTIECGQLALDHLSYEDFGFRKEE